MTRDDAAAYVAARYGGYLTAAARGVTDSPGALGEVIDDALRALGYPTGDLATAEPLNPMVEDDYRLQLSYRTLDQVVRDLGASEVDVSLSVGSFRFKQRVSAEKDLERLSVQMLERFGTLSASSTATTGSPFVTVQEALFWPELP
jgi:hypothetical protein